MTAHDRALDRRPGWDRVSAVRLVAGILWQGFAVWIAGAGILAKSGDPARDFMVIAVWSSVPVVLAAGLAGLQEWRATTGYWRRFATWFFLLSLPVGFVVLLSAI
jgi:hypothetical protein